MIPITTRLEQHCIFEVILQIDTWCKHSNNTCILSVLNTLYETHTVSELCSAERYHLPRRIMRKLILQNVIAALTATGCWRNYSPLTHTERWYLSAEQSSLTVWFLCLYTRILLSHLSEPTFGRSIWLLVSILLVYE